MKFNYLSLVDSHSQYKFRNVGSFNYFNLSEVYDEVESYMSVFYCLKFDYISIHDTREYESLDEPKRIKNKISNLINQTFYYGRQM